MNWILLLICLQVHPLLGKHVDIAIDHFKSEGCVVVKEQISPNTVIYCDCPDKTVRIYHKNEEVGAIVQIPK